MPKNVGVRSATGKKDRHAILDVLTWLWDVIAEPVLAALGYTRALESNDLWPRVWSCPTGPLTVLPVHAAGHHPRLRTATRNTECVLDRVISSYTPTLTALARAHEPGQPAPVRQLAIGMPRRPASHRFPQSRRNGRSWRTTSPQENSTVRYRADKQLTLP